MVYVDSTFEARRKKILGGNVTPQGSLSDGSSYDSSFQARRSTVLSQPVQVQKQPVVTQPVQQPKQTAQPVTNYIKNVVQTNTDTLNKIKSTVSSGWNYLSSAIGSGLHSFATNPKVQPELENIKREFTKIEKYGLLSPAPVGEGNVDIVEGKTIQKPATPKAGEDWFQKVTKEASIFMNEVLGGVTFNNFESKIPKTTVPEKVAGVAGQVVGTGVAIRNLNGIVTDISLKNATLVTAMKNYPKVTKILYPVLKNVLSFDIYGQLKIDQKNRAQRLAFDTALGVTTSGLGFIKNAPLSIVSNFALGYGLAKAGGLSNEDALITGGVLAFMDTGNRLQQSLFQMEISKNGIKDMNPQDAINSVIGTPLENTPFGKQIIKLSIEATNTGSNVRISVGAKKPAKVAKILGSKKPATGNLNVEIVPVGQGLPSPTTETGKTETTGMIIPEKPPIGKGGGVGDIKAVFMQKSGEYTSAKDLAQGEFGQPPTAQIGFMPPEAIIARDPVDPKQVAKIEADIQAGKTIEPIIVSTEDGKLTTVDGTQRLTAFQNQGQPVPVVYTGKDTIEGLSTFEKEFGTVTEEKPPVVEKKSDFEIEQEKRAIEAYGTTPDEYIKKYYEGHGYPSQQGLEAYVQANSLDLPNGMTNESILARAKELYPKGIPETHEEYEQKKPVERDVAKTLRESKGLSADDIIKKYPDINLKRDVPITDIHGNKDVIEKGEALTPYELKGNKVLLKDGETYIVSKNQFQNIKGNATTGEAKEFAPEMKGTEETVKFHDYQGKKLTPSENKELNELGRRLTNDGLEGADKKRWNELMKIRNEEWESKSNTKFNQYTLPGGENYREILIKAPEGKSDKIDKKLNDWAIENYKKPFKELSKEAQNQIISDLGLQNAPTKKETFQSSHWDEPNVIAHVRMNDRLTPDDKKVSFIEEIQSDWAREGRKQGFAEEITKDFAKKAGYSVYKAKSNLGTDAYFLKSTAIDRRLSGIGSDTEAEAWERIIEHLKEQSTAIPAHPLLKNWQELAIKRALQEAVTTGSEYMAWITGEQTSARYNLATYVKDVNWFLPDTAKSGLHKTIELTPKTGSRFEFEIDNKGIIKSVEEGVPTDWKGKKLDEVLGKGLADKILEKDSGTLSGEGLKFGGEWANNLYDKQIKNIVEDITGQKVEIVKVESGKKLIGYESLPKEAQVLSDKLTAEDITTMQFSEELEKINLYPKFNEAGELDSILSIGDLIEQQAIKITPEVKAIVKGEAPVLKKASGETPIKEWELKSSRGYPVITGNPPIVEESKYGLKVGDRITEIGVPGKNGKETSSHRVQTFEEPVIYEGTVTNIGLPGKQLSFKYVENGETYHLLYTAMNSGYILASDATGKVNMQYSAVFKKQGVESVIDEKTEPSKVNTKPPTEAISEKTLSEYAKPQVYGLSDKPKEGVYLRFGRPPSEGSGISNTGRLEKGVSTYSAYYDEKSKLYIIGLNPGDDGNVTLDSFIGTGKKAYVVEGKQLSDVGADSEYLLDPKSVKIIKEIPTSQITDYNMESTFDGEEIAPENRPVITESEDLTLAPSEAGTPEEQFAEAMRIGIPDKYKYMKVGGKDEGAYLRPAIGRSDFKTLLNNMAEFKKNPIFVVDENKNLVFKGRKSSMSITPEALQLNTERLNVGDRIKVDVVKMKKAMKGTQQLRVNRGGSAYASTGAEKIGAYEKITTAGTNPSDFKLFEKSKELVRKYAERIGEKYLSRGAGGLYHPESNNIRTNGMNDLSTNIHEIAHAVDKRYKISPQIREVIGYTDEGKPKYDGDTLDLRKAITELYTKYYVGGKKGHSVKKRVTEGFATLIQKYVEMPTTIKAEFPELVHNFLEPTGTYFNSTVDDLLTDARTIVGEYQALSDLDKIGSRIVNDTMETDKTFLNPLEKVRTFMEDEIYPVEKLGKLAGTQWTGDDPSLWLRNYSRGGGLYANNVLHDKTGYWTLNESGDAHKTLPYNWKNLMDRLSDSKTTDSFGYFLIARDQASEWKELDRLKEVYLEKQEAIAEEAKAQGLSMADIRKLPEIMRETGEDYSDLMTAIDEATKARKDVKEQEVYLSRNGFLREEVDSAYQGNKDRFIKESEMYDALVREDLNLLHNPLVGIVNDTAYEEYISKEGYASMKRKFFDDILGDAKEVYGGAGGKLAPKVSSLKKRTGGQQMIINPVLNGIVNHVEITKKSLKQIVYNKIAPIAHKGLVPDLLQEVAVVSYPDENGRIIFPQDKDPKVIMARVDYKRTPILVDTIIKNTIDNVLTFQSMNIFEHMLVTLGRTFTLGTTGAYAPFALVNYPADQWNAVVNTRNNYKPVIDQIKVIGQLMAGKGGDAQTYWNEWQIMGGDRMTLFQSQLQSTNDAIKYIRKETKGLERVVSLLDKGVDIMSIPSKYSETVSRFSEYYASRKAGKSQVVAFEEAGRITAPFHHIGAWKWGDKATGKNIVRSVPFANAGIQVLGQAIRTAETPEGKKRLAWVILAMSALYLTSIAMIKMFGTKDQQEQYKDLKPTDLAMYLHYPSITGKGVDRIRVSQELSTIGTIISMVVAQQVLGAKYKFSDYQQALTEWIPRHLNIMQPLEMFFAWMSVIKTPFELIGNFKDYPRVSPLENMSMTGREPRDRWNEGTSWLAKKIGDVFNLSPIKIDYLLSQTLGRSVGFFTIKPKIFNPTSAVHREYLFTLGRRIENFYEESTKVDQQVKSMKNKWLDKTDIPQSEQEKYSALKEKQAMYNLFDKYLKEFRDIDQNDTAKLQKAREQMIPILEKLLEL